MFNDDDYAYENLTKRLSVSNEAAREFVHQVNDFLPHEFSATEVYYNLVGLPAIYRNPRLVAWSIIARNKLDPGNKLPHPFLPPRRPFVGERKVWVAGLEYENRQAVCDRLQIGETVLLRRELFNPFDIHAIAVENNQGEKLGYIPRGEAFWCAYSLDVYGKPLEATVKCLTNVSGFRIFKALLITFVMPPFSPTVGITNGVKENQSVLEV